MSQHGAQDIYTTSYQRRCNCKTDTKTLKFMLYISEIEFVENYKYLGVVLFYKGNSNYDAIQLYQTKFEGVFFFNYV